MRKLLFFLGISLGVACNQSSENIPVATAQVGVAATENKVSRDTQVPPVKRKYIIDTSRPVKDINTTFPFDIELKKVDGTTVNSAEALRANGKPTVLLFWLTTCYPCRVELAAIEREMAQWKKEADFNIVAISTDFQKNYDKFVKRVNESQWSFEAYNDSNREFRKVLPGALNGLPQTFLFDAEGNIVLHKRKYSSGDEHLLFEKVKALAAK